MAVLWKAPSLHLLLLRLPVPSRCISSGPKPCRVLASEAAVGLLCFCDHR